MLSSIALSYKIFNSLFNYSEIIVYSLLELYHYDPQSKLHMGMLNWYDCIRLMHMWFSKFETNS